MYQNITMTTDILGGKPCIKGTRISVEFILELFASGATHADILEAYPQLSQEAIKDALRYAAQVLKNDVLFTAEITA